MSRQRLWGGILVILMVGITCLLFAPATWLSHIVSESSRARLLYPSGTLWDGSAILALGDGRSARALPGRIVWHVQWKEVLRGDLAVDFHHPTIERPVTVRFDGRSVTLHQGQAVWPAAMLEILGAPFNTVSPGGLLLIRWGDCRFSETGFDGSVQVDWNDAQSALSPVVPLGDFRVFLEAAGGTGSASLVTLKGPLLLEGAGHMERGQVRFSGTADAEPGMRDRLNGLIGILGPRSGEKVLLNWEYRT